jgi:peptide/nickel transport system substrate-binding protein
MAIHKHLWLVVSMMIVVLVVSACGGEQATTESTTTQEEEEDEEASTDDEEEEEDDDEDADDEDADDEEESASTDGDCPAVTIADRAGVDAGDYPRQYELADYEAAADCTMAFQENPDIADLNDQITNNPDLPPVEERLPAEPLVIVPYEAIGEYGGQLDALSNATEAGTSDFLSVRHVNLVRYGDDYRTIEPNVAKGWEWNDDFTELTVFLREGHKWSDGEPFTANDVAFWMNDLILNPDVYPETPGFVTFGDDTMQVEVIDDTTFKFIFPVPTPGILSFFATTYIQPWQPEHFFDQKAEEDMSLAEVAELYYGNSDWTDTPSPLLGGQADDVLPTLESHILVEESTEGRHLVANPYFFMVDTVGNQLPYINEQDELYVPDSEVRNLKIANGEVDYKVQSIDIIDYPLYKENEESGNYTADLGFGVGETIFYGFNLTHPDEALREIFNDLRFRQAMSLAINREEIVELVYLGQAEPIQATPADPNTVNFVTEAHKTAFIEYDPEQANALLDEMGLVDADGDGFRDRLDGSNFTLDLQFATQGGPGATHELIKGYWEDVGVATRVKEVTSDEYRERANANQADVLTWKFDGTAGAIIVLNTEMLLPPFGEPFNPGIAYGWEEWVRTEGESGVEPPDDVIELYDIVAEFLQEPLGSPESDELGEQIVDIHVDNLWKIGIAGNVRQPIIRHNTLQNFGPYDVVSYDYYRSYPMIPAQWYFSE